MSDAPPGPTRRSSRPGPADPVRPTWVEVDPGAVAHNVEVLRRVVAPADLWAVVKADGYGHGAAVVAAAALGAGAAGLAVALVEEAEELRDAGIGGRILLLSEPPAGSAERVVAASIEPAVYSAAVIEELDAAARGVGVVVAVHLKVDTGMHRVGADATEAPRLAQAVASAPGLTLASVWSHLAIADEPDDPFTAEQVARLDAACAAIAAAGVSVPARHLANSAGGLAHPDTRLDLVRAGIAVYGLAPSAALSGRADLRPALRLVSAVTHVKVVEAGETVSYGRRHRVEAATTIATVPVGYADGVRRTLGAKGFDVLIGGRRRRVAGTVTMDQITVDCGPDADIRRGDEVVLLGAQGDEEITAEEWADCLDTIGYEVTCGLGARLPRRVVPGARG